jgi:hypothetical protein
MNPLIQFAETCIDCKKDTWHPKPGPRCALCYAEYETQLRVLMHHPDLKEYNEFTETFYGFEFEHGARLGAHGDENRDRQY